EFKAGADGGIVQVTANRYRKLSVYKNQFTGTLKAINGGFLCLYGNIPVHPWSDKITFLNNTVGASASVTNGGFVMISGNQDQSFLFKGNEFSGSMNALNKGGIIALVNGAGNCDSIMISGNKFLPAAPNSLIMAKTGGVLHYEGNFTAKVFQFSQNKVKQARADSEGAVLYVRNNAPNGYQDICQITDNEFDNLSTEINGAVISQNGPVRKRFLFKNNLLSNVFMTGSNSNGGALYLHIGLQNKINTVGIENNKVISETSLGGGTFLKFTGSVADTMLVKRNSFTDISSKLTGAFDVNADTISHFISTANQVREVSGQIGALYYLAGNDKAYLKNVSLAGDTMKVVHASGEGGVVFLNFPVCSSFSVEKSVFERVTSGATGGFLAARKGILLPSLVFNQVEAKNSSAGQNGGFAGIAGTFGTIQVMDNFHQNSFAAGNGGSFYLESLNAMSGMMQVNTSRFEGDKVKTSGSGGAFYMESLGVAEFNYSLFRDLRVTNNGGAVYARVFNRILMEICNFYGNRAVGNSGGSLFLESFAQLNTVKNVFRENLAKASGGAFFIRDGHVAMKNDSVVGNSAFTGGGGTFVYTGGTLDSLSIKQNYTSDPTHVQSLGGGLYIEQNSLKPIEMEDCWFYKNNAYQGGGMYGTQSSSRQIRSTYAYNLSSKNGGAVYLLGSPATVFYNSIFHRNSVIRLDYEIPPTAGIHVFSVSPSNDSVRIVNSVFNRNNSFAVGLEIPEGRKVSEYKPVEIANSILFYNGYLAEDIPQYKGNDGLINFIYSDVEDLDLKKYGATNINLLPNWLTPNYCLRTALPFVSPCIDRGNPVAAFNDPDGTRNDMGITGGPYAKYFCSDAYFRDDNSPVEDEEIQQSGFAIYPNPTSGKIWIVPGSVIGQSFTIDVISPFGKTIWSERKETGSGSRTEIDLGNLPNGLYLIQVRNLSSRVVQKIIKM
ncbi:MAG TPA: T9SS type A sorting domain-containing protein, partial [Prolixibacteraceae bacterium]|nr:T9SS type A sorting domain-containing protein [Prolixibacteraceae bacterium]